jgi:hypothetical protein
MSDLVPALARVLDPIGLNVIGATDVARYDAAVPARWRLRLRAPETRGLVVIGNGGGAFWSSFERARGVDSELRAGPDPLDAFTRAVVAETVAPVLAERGLPCRVIHPFDDGPVTLSFVHAAAAAGLGRPSLLGLLLHPTYGPWMALRAALLLPVAPRAPRPADGFDPCPTCVTRPCVAVCPSAAVSATGWDVATCMATSGHGDDPCAAACHSRLACVVGPEHRYPPAALAHHHGAARRRRPPRS